MRHDSQQTQDCLSKALVAGFVSGTKAAVVSGGLFYAVSGCQLQEHYPCTARVNALA
jgi:hypothetical protein